MDPPLLLTAEEIAAFKRDGWFLRRNILDLELCARCRELIWETPGGQCMLRVGSGWRDPPHPPARPQPNPLGAAIPLFIATPF